ncbi:TMEM175 family protein [Streptomyces mirabilis]
MVPCPAAPALSDGIYAIAMTLLVINVAIPAHLDDDAFHKALGDALPHLGAFAVITRLTLLGLGLVALQLFPWPSSTRKQP